MSFVLTNRAFVLVAIRVVNVLLVNGLAVLYLMQYVAVMVSTVVLVGIRVTLMLVHVQGQLR